MAGLHDVLPSIAASLGVTGFEDAFALPRSQRYVLFVVDGLGAELLDAHAELAPFLSGLERRDGVQSPVPSTTATSLTSLGTGRRPGSHGVVGYTCREPASGRRLNSLTWSDDVDPLQWQPHATVLGQVADAGVPAAVVNDTAFENSGLTLCGQRGAAFHGIDSLWARTDTILDVVEASRSGVVYAYESRLDHTGHRYGCGSEQWRETLSTIDADLADLRAELPSDTTLVVTADHGMIDLPLEDRFDLEELPVLRDDVTLVAGEARFRHLYTRAGAADAVAERWRAELGDRAVVRTQHGIEDWFGPIEDRVRPRIGDVVVAALENFAVFSSRDFAIEFHMVGFHGSITAAERSVPLLVAP